MSIEAATAVSTVKLSGYFGAVAIFEYLQIPQQQMCILGLLMFIDFITGVGKQLRIDPSKLTSRDAWIGAMKKSVTVILVFTLALVLKGVNLLSEEYISFVLSILIMAEGYSAIQNGYAVRTGIILPEFDVISVLMKSLGDSIKDKINKAIPEEKMPTNK